MPHIVTLVKYIQSKQTKANCYNGEGKLDFYLNNDTSVARYIFTCLHAR